MSAGTATLRPAAAGLRSGYDDHQQHTPASATKAACGAAIREQRYDRPDWPRCLDCVAVVGIAVPRPTAAAAPVSELEQRALWGDR